MKHNLSQGMLVNHTFSQFLNVQGADYKCIGKSLEDSRLPNKCIKGCIPPGKLNI